MVKKSVMAVMLVTGLSWGIAAQDAGNVISNASRAIGAGPAAASS